MSGLRLFLSFCGLILFFLSLKVGVSEGSVLRSLIFTFYIWHPLAVTHLLLPFLPSFLKSRIRPPSPSLQHPFSPSAQLNLCSVLQTKSKLLKNTSPVLEPADTFQSLPYPAQHLTLHSPFDTLPVRSLPFILPHKPPS